MWLVIHLTDNNMNISAGKSTYVVFSSLVGVPFFIFITVLVTKWPAPGVIYVLLLLLFLESAGCFWISRFNLRIDNESIYYRSLFSGTVHIKLQEIKSVRYRVGATKYKDRFMPNYRLEIKDKNNKLMIVNLKVFNISDVRKLNEHLNIK